MWMKVTLIKQTQITPVNAYNQNYLAALIASDEFVVYTDSANQSKRYDQMLSQAKINNRLGWWVYPKGFY